MKLGKSYFCLIFVLSSVCNCWNYNEQGKDWEGLCATGEGQSPVLVEEAYPLSQFFFFPRFNSNSDLSFVEEDQTLKLKGEIGYLYAPEPYATIHLLKFKATHIEFHAPSEHVFKLSEGELLLKHSKYNVNSENAKNEDLQQFDLEMQIYFDFVGSTRIPGKENGAVSFFFNKGEESPFLKEFITEEDPIGKTHKINFDLLYTPDIVNFNAFYVYRGSRTRPPCTEDLNWYLLKSYETLTLSEAQLNFFNNRWKGNPDFAKGNGNNRAPKPQPDMFFVFPRQD